MRRMAKWRRGIGNPGGGKIEAKALADAGDWQAGTTHTAGSPAHRRGDADPAGDKLQPEGAAMEQLRHRPVARGGFV